LEPKKSRHQPFSQTLICSKFQLYDIIIKKNCLHCYSSTGFILFAVKRKLGFFKSEKKVCKKKPEGQSTDYGVDTKFFRHYSVVWFDASLGYSFVGW
jgi:hypothetical protein